MVPIRQIGRSYVALVVTALFALFIPAVGFAGEPTVTLACVGDVLLGRGVASAIARHGADYPFAKTRGILQSADIAFCNLECALTKRTQTSRPPKWALRADPGTAKILTKAGFDIASLANNHTQDFGEAGLSDTHKALTDAGIALFDTSPGLGRPAQPVVVTKRGLKIGFLGFRPDKDTLRTARVISFVEARSKCDALVVYFHWGEEYSRRPSAWQRELAHAAVDAGADLVIGSHPHVLQTVETYKGTPIVYSMGNFVWDSRILGSGTSAIYVFTVQKKSVKLVRELPIAIRFSQPHPSPNYSQ